MAQAPYPTNLAMSYGPSTPLEDFMSTSTIFQEEDPPQNFTELFHERVPSQGGTEKDLSISIIAEWIQNDGHTLFEITKSILGALPTVSIEAQIAIKRLFATGIYPQYGKYLTPSDATIKPTIHEDHFNNLSQNILALNENLRKLHIDVDKRVNRISGATSTLKQGSSDPQFALKKSNARPLLDHYEALYNTAVDYLGEMRTIVHSIEKLQGHVTSTIDEFIKLNDRWNTYLIAQFNQIAAEKDYVQQRITTGVESRQTQIINRFWGAGAALPAAKNPLNSAEDSQAIGPCTEFSPFFCALNNNYHELKLFTQIDVQLLSNGISGTRKGWTEANPLFDDFKASATSFPKAYEVELETGHRFHDLILSSNIKLSELKKVLSAQLTCHLTEIARNKAFLLSIFKTYREESQTLDRTMHENSLAVTSQLKELKADSTEKFPVII